MKRTPGRPPLDDDDDSVSVHLRMSAAQYTETYRRAQEERKTVPEVIRADVADSAARKKGFRYLK